MILHQQVRMLIVNDEFQPLLTNLVKALNIEVVAPEGRPNFANEFLSSGKTRYDPPFPGPT